MHIQTRESNFCKEVLSKHTTNLHLKEMLVILQIAVPSKSVTVIIGRICSQFLIAIAPPPQYGNGVQQQGNLETKDGSLLILKFPLSSPKPVPGLLITNPLSCNKQG